MPSFPDPDDFPVEFSPGEKAILRAQENLHREAREVTKAEHAENQARLDKLEHEMMSTSAAMKAAFPDGDFAAHCRHHEAVIQKEKARAELYRTLTTRLIEKGLWALVIAVGAAVWFYVGDIIRHGPK